MSVQEFLEKGKRTAEAKAIEMARLELSVWDANHEAVLIRDFGFTAKTVVKHKRKLENQANGIFA